MNGESVERTYKGPTNTEVIATLVPGIVLAALLVDPAVVAERLADQLARDDAARALGLVVAREQCDQTRVVLCMQHLLSHHIICMGHCSL